MRFFLDQYGWSLIDIALIAFGVYQVLLLIRGTRAAQMLTGILLLVGLFATSSLLPLTTLHWLLSKLYPSLILIVIVLFQDDIRFVLSSFGKKSFIPGSESISSKQILDEVVKVAFALAEKKYGALIVFERAIILNRYINVGVPIGARVTKELLLAIFHPTSPIHDGAAILQRGRLASAGSFLPLSKEETLNLQWGTRHRAALGLTQETDAIVVLISEERKSVHLASNGIISEALNQEELLHKLQEFFAEKDEKMLRRRAGRLRVLAGPKK